MEGGVSKKRAGLWIAATIVGPLLFYFFFSGFYIGIWYAQTKHQGPPTPEVMINSMFIGYPPAIWAVVAFWWCIHRKKAQFGELFLARSSNIVSDIAVGIGLGALWVVFYGLMDVVVWREMFTIDLTKIASFPASLSAGFGEEFLFRGFLFWLLAAAGAGKGSRLVVASIAFGLSHCLWGPWGMFWTAILGFTFGLVVLWRDSVWPAVVAHTLLNLCIEPGLIEKAMSSGFTA